MPKFAVVLPAAGKSSRFGGKDKKVFANLDGRPVWLRSAELFVNRADVMRVVVAIAPEDLEMVRQRYGAHIGLLGLHVASGGAARADSIANALKEIGDEADFVAVHDAARPCLSTELIDEVFKVAAKVGAALLALPIPDTVKRTDNQGKVEATVSRQGLWLAQTPQVFRRDWLSAAYSDRAMLGREATDDAELIEAAGHPVFVVEGSSTNIKITTREDLALAEAVLKSRPKPKAARPIHPFDDDVKW
jgi:2-C-methyl-D-erythritol 4-phosphate cytidylyltransferase